MHAQRADPIVPPPRLPQGTRDGRRIGSSQAYISRVLNGGANFTLATMTKLAMGLGMELKMHLAPADAFTVRTADR